MHLWKHPLALLSLIVMPVVPALADPATAAAQMAGNVKISAGTSTVVGDKLILHGEGANPARIQSPEVDITAQEISFITKENHITQVTAQGKVNFKGDITPKGGGTPAHIEATSDNANLDPMQRTLIMHGNVKGWAQVKDKGRDTIDGEDAVLKYDTNKNFNIKVTSGAQDVRVVLPSDKTAKTGLGTVVVTAHEAVFNSIDDSARFSGNAHAVSDDTPNKFDLSAGAFLVSRGASGTLDTLNTVGRATLKLDMPPAPGASGSAAATSNAFSIGRPTHLEVSADSVIVAKDKQTIVADGNVQGFYRLASGAAPGDYKFNGDNAVARIIAEKEATTDRPAGLNVVVTGKPVTIEAPGLTLD